MPERPDYYVLLGVGRSASQDEIKRAYYDAAQRLHPDKNKTVGETELFLDIQQAYETLSNPKRRAKYDATLPPEEQSLLPVDVKICYSRPNLVRSNEPQMIYVLLAIEPQLISGEIPTPSLNVCLVLDCSTSMKDEKMDVLKRAAIRVMHSLRSHDIFSVVTFSDRAEVLIPASHPSDKSKLEARIQMLQPSGATEIFQGLQAALTEIQRKADEKYVNHIILLTDGHTYGDEQDSFKLAEQAAEQGIGISAMGIGQEWNDSFLDTLANRTSGSSRYIARAEDINRFLMEKLDILAHVLADDVTLSFSQLPGIEMTFAFRTQPETGPLSTESPSHLGSILYDTNLNILFEFKISPLTTSHDNLTLLRGILHLAIASIHPAPPVSIELSCSVKDHAGTELPPEAIIHAMSKLTLYRMQERVQTEVENGQFELAARHLKQLATNLLSQEERRLARTAMIEAENILQMQTFSEEGRKEIKYGTRSLLLPSSKE